MRIAPSTALLRRRSRHLMRWTTATIAIACMACIATEASAADDRLKDLLGRAQQGLDGKAVEDLIGKLEGSRKASVPSADPMNGLRAGQPLGKPAVDAAPATPSIDGSASAAGVTLPTTAPSPAGRETEAGSITRPDTPPPANPVTALPAGGNPSTGASANAPPAPAAPPTPPVPITATAEPPGPPAAPPAPAEQELATANRTQEPSVDLEIPFEFNSSEVGPAALPVLALLGRALSDPRLASSTFLIAGHTDAKGRADYNRHLSQSRAEAVRTFLIAHYGIEAKRLSAKGYGETRLKNPRNPLAEENRRVQVINTSKTASR